MKIGEFAAFCGASIRALRLYDRMGLIKPAFIDAETGYRYYQPEQMQQLNAIISLKKVGFSLGEIKKIVNVRFDRDDVVRGLTEKRQENERIIAVCRYNVENIDSMLSTLGAAATAPDEQAEAVKVSKIVCLENEKLEHDFSQILWL